MPPSKEVGWPSSSFFCSEANPNFRLPGLNGSKSHYTHGVRYAYYPARELEERAMPPDPGIMKLEGQNSHLTRSCANKCRRGPFVARLIDELVPFLLKDAR